MRITVTTTTGDTTYKLSGNDLPAGATTKSIADVFANAIDPDNPASSAITQHLDAATHAYKTFNAAHVVSVEVSDDVTPTTTP